MRCANCQNLWSEPTGHVLSPATRLCGPCARLFKIFVKDQEGRRLQRHRSRPSAGAQVLLVAAAVLLALLSLSQGGCAADLGTPAQMRLSVVATDCGPNQPVAGEPVDAVLLDDGTIQVDGTALLLCTSTGRSLDCALDAAGDVPGYDARVTSHMRGFLAWRQPGQLAGDVQWTRTCTGSQCGAVVPGWEVGGCSTLLWFEVQLPRGETWSVLPEPGL